MSVDYSCLFPTGSSHRHAPQKRWRSISAGPTCAVGLGKAVAGLRVGGRIVSIARSLPRSRLDAGRLRAPVTVGNRRECRL